MKRNILAVFFLLLLTSCTRGFIVKYHIGLDQIHKKQDIHDIRVALVLSGGGARTIAQASVIEVFEENNIPIDLIVGCSGGSIVGVLYADNPDAKLLKEKLFALKRENIFSYSLLGFLNVNHSILDGDAGEKFLEDNLTARDFSELKIPFIAVSTDIVTNKIAAIGYGPIIPAVRASYAVPGFFSPVKLYGMTLVDGGLIAPLPVDIAKAYKPKLIIAVDVMLPVDQDKVHNTLDLLWKSMNVVHNALNDRIGKDANILIKIKSNSGMFEGERKEELYAAGRKAAEDALVEIRKQLKLKKIPLKPRYIVKK